MNKNDENKSSYETIMKVEYLNKNVVQIEIDSQRIDFLIENLLS